MSEDQSTAAVIRQLREEVRSLAGRLQHAEAKLAEVDSPFGRLVMFRRTGAVDSPSNRQWREYSVVNGQVVEFPDGRGCDDEEHPAALLTSNVEWAVEVPDVDAMRYIPLVSRFKVNLSTDGGNAGSASAQCDFTYSVSHFDGGGVIGTEKSPELPQRPALGPMVAATAGWAYYDISGVLHIEICNEVEDVLLCS